jgi:hydroxymethylpyrimidine/phosphomethylpyrimidine kinase
MTVLEDEFIPDKNIRGTGCMLASAIAANLALGEDLPRSVRSAKTFVNDLISGN